MKLHQNNWIYPQYHINKKENSKRLRTKKISNENENENDYNIVNINKIEKEKKILQMTGRNLDSRIEKSGSIEETE